MAVKGKKLSDTWKNDFTKDPRPYGRALRARQAKNRKAYGL